MSSTIAESAAETVQWLVDQILRWGWMFFVGTVLLVVIGVFLSVCDRPSSSSGNDEETSPPD